MSSRSLAIIAPVLLAACATVTRPTAVATPLVGRHGVPSGPAAAAWSPDGATLALARPKGLVLRGLGRALAAGARLPKRGARNGQEPPAADPDTGKPKEHRVKEPAPPEPPVSREPPPRPRTYSIDVEEAFLQRIASYIEEIRLANGSAESGDGRDAPRNARS